MQLNGVGGGSGHRTPRCVTGKRIRSSDERLDRNAIALIVPRAERARLARLPPALRGNEARPGRQAGRRGRRRRALGLPGRQGLPQRAGPPAARREAQAAVGGVRGVGREGYPRRQRDSHAHAPHAEPAHRFLLRLLPDLGLVHGNEHCPHRHGLAAGPHPRGLVRAVRADVQAADAVLALPAGPPARRRGDREDKLHTLEVPGHLREVQGRHDLRLGPVRPVRQPAHCAADRRAAHVHPRGVPGAVAAAARDAQADGVHGAGAVRGRGQVLREVRGDDDGRDPVEPSVRRDAFPLLRKHQARGPRPRHRQGLLRGHLPRAHEARLWPLQPLVRHQARRVAHLRRHPARRRLLPLLVRLLGRAAHAPGGDGRGRAGGAAEDIRQGGGERQVGGQGGEVQDRGRERQVPAGGEAGVPDFGLRGGACRSGTC